MSGSPARGGSPPPQVYLVALAAFVSLGLPDTFLGVAWPTLSREIGQSLDRLGWVVAAGMIGYLVSCLSGDLVVRRIGVGRLLAISSALVTLSLVTTSVATRLAAVLAAATTAGLGAGAIDTGINSYAAAHFPPRFVNWLHAAYGLGAIGGPAIMSAALAQAGWRSGYRIGAVLLAGSAVLALATRGAWTDGATAPITAPATTGGSRSAPRLGVGVGVALFFGYTGLEVTTASWAYTVLTEGRRVAPMTAGVVVIGFWVALTVGRLVAGTIATRIGGRRVLRVALGAAVPAAIGWGAADGLVGSAVSLWSMGLLFAPVFPTLVSSTPERAAREQLGRLMGLQVGAAYLGAAMMPLVAGAAAARLGLGAVPWVPPALAILLLPLVLRLQPTRSRNQAASTPSVQR